MSHQRLWAIGCLLAANTALAKPDIKPWASAPPPPDDTAESPTPTSRQHRPLSSPRGSVVGGKELFDQPVRCEIDRGPGQAVHRYDIAWTHAKAYMQEWHLVEVHADAFDRGPDKYEGTGVDFLNFLYVNAPTELNIHVPASQVQYFMDLGQVATFMKFPLKAGDTGAAIAYDDWHFYRVVGLEKVTLDGKPIDAAHLEIGLMGDSTGGELKYSDMWFAPNLGLVKLQNRDDPKASWAATTCESTNHNPVLRGETLAAENKSKIFQLKRDLGRSLDNNNFGAASSQAHNILQLDPKNPEGHRYACYSALMRENLSFAEQRCEEALKHFPDNHDILLASAFIQIRSGKMGGLDLADRAFKAKASPDARALRALGYFLAGQISLAEDDVEYIVNNPTQKRATFTYGEANQTNRQFDRIEEPLVIAHFVKSMVLVNKGDFAAAKTSLDTAKATLKAALHQTLPKEYDNPNKLRLYEIQELFLFPEAMIAWKTGDVATAEATFKKTQSRYKTRLLTVILENARFANAQNRPDEALSLVNSVMETNPTFGDAAYLRCDLNTKKGNWATARSDCELCLKQSARNPICKKGLAEAQKH